MALFWNISFSAGQRNCTWFYTNAQDCQTELWLGFDCDTNNYPTSTSIPHDHDVIPIICQIGINAPACGGWVVPGSDSLFFSCGFCGYKEDSLCLGANENSFKYIYAETAWVPGQQQAYDYKQAQQIFIDEQVNIPQTYCCSPPGPQSCSTNNCGAPEIKWEEKTLFLHGAYFPYYLNCPPPKP